MSAAKLFIRRNGSFGASIPGMIRDTGHHILEDSGRFTVFGDDNKVICENGTRDEAEVAITEDWKEA
jgi:hypothetical protein